MKFFIVSEPGRSGGSFNGNCRLFMTLSVLFMMIINDKESLTFTIVI
ncbi:hypothetical protein ACFP65_07755 [Marinilactibacillus sp. GCM10026970]